MLPQEIVAELPDGTLLLVDVDRDLAAGGEELRQGFEGRLGVRRVVDDLVAGDVVEVARGEGQGPASGDPVSARSLAGRTPA